MPGHSRRGRHTVDIVLRTHESPTGIVISFLRVPQQVAESLLPGTYVMGTAPCGLHTQNGTKVTSLRVLAGASWITRLRFYHTEPGKSKQGWQQS